MTILRLLSRRIIHIALSIIFERAIEATTFVGGKRDAMLKTVDQIWVASEEAAIQKSIVATIFQDTPGVRLVPAAAGEERRRAEDLAEAAQVYVEKTPAAEEFVLFFVAEDLFVALGFC